MKKIMYFGEEVEEDSYYKHILWNRGHTHFAVARKCPLCGQWCGTGVQYNADEPIYSVAEDYANKAVAEHIKYCH